ncbi:hypothetical protein CW713_11005 [Methanophagales archaeon]|nr:MAG: hypothetical protein CW713_11005 [Methanophagales archaeon]
MGRIERAPNWILKYKERLDKGAIAVEDILEAENKTREKPMKISSVTRAINALGYPITDLRRGKQVGAEAEEKKKESAKARKGPDWLQKYREGIEKGTITVEDILEAENKIRKIPIKLITVSRAINAMGYSTAGLRRGKKAEPVKEKAEQRGPDWLQKYREGIEKGTITVEDILEAENKIRKVPIKLSTVTRAINTMGYPITGLRRKKEEAEGKVIRPKKAVSTGEAVDYSSSIGKISKETEKRFNAIKKSWEKDLNKSLHNDYFVNILLALAKLVEHGKTLTFTHK